jgi:hypothetical protein
MGFMLLSVAIIGMNGMGGFQHRSIRPERAVDGKNLSQDFSIEDRSVALTLRRVRTSRPQK